MSKNTVFDHESLQDRKSIKKYLKVIMDGLSKGVITFSDGATNTTLEPDGLVAFRVAVSDDRGQKNLAISINWKDADGDESTGAQPLQITSGGMIE